MAKRTTGRRTWTPEQLAEAVATSISIRAVLTQIGLRPTGGNYSNIGSWIEELKLDTAHFQGQGWCKNPPRFRWTTEQILIENSPYTNSHKLRIRLLFEGVLEPCCYNCKLTMWLDKPIPLELEHKNGNRRDNRRENLELLCPNCHALTSTYRGKNKSPG